MAKYFSRKGAKAQEKIFIERFLFPISVIELLRSPRKIINDFFLQALNLCGSATLRETFLVLACPG